MIRRLIKLYIFKLKWRKRNKHNFTHAKNFFPSKLVTVGEMTYGPLNVSTWGAENEKLSIGNYVSIATGVKFLLGGNHRYDNFSTYPFKVKIRGDASEALSKGPITIGDDVWICTNSLILSGVTVGQGAVIAAGSIVVKDVPPYSIVGGNPAKVIKYRFDDEIIDKLIRINYSNIKKNSILKNMDILYETLNLDNLNTIQKHTLYENENEDKDTDFE